MPILWDIDACPCYYRLFRQCWDTVSENGTHQALNTNSGRTCWREDWFKLRDDVDGLVQERRNSSVSAMGLCLSCANPLMLYPGSCCNAGYASETYFKLKTHKIMFIYIIYFSCQIVLQFCTGHSSDTAVPCAKLQNNLTAEIDNINEQNFVRFPLLI